MCRFWINSFQRTTSSVDATDLPSLAESPLEESEVLSFHRSLPEYHMTPLVTLPALADSLGLGAVYVKDESYRLGLKAFKVLGASYAICRVIAERYKAATGKSLSPAQLFDAGISETIGYTTLCTATDGNHGRAVAWTARRLGQKAVIYLPAGTVPARIENIRSEGAEVIIVDGSYDDAVIRAAEDAAAQGWQVISDTSYDGYTEIPAIIMSGYSTLLAEIDDALQDHNRLPPTTCFVQAGVGALAAAIARYYTERIHLHQIDLVSVEPLSADCVLQAVRADDNMVQRIAGQPDSIMSGLNCGRASPVALPFIRAGFKLFLAVSDDFSRQAMRKLFYPSGSDESIVSGESGAAGLAGLLALCHSDSLRDARHALNLNRDSRVLLINTEGDTDPEGFQKIIAET